MAWGRRRGSDGPSASVLPWVARGIYAGVRMLLGVLAVDRSAVRLWSFDLVTVLFALRGMLLPNRPQGDDGDVPLRSFDLAVICSEWPSSSARSVVDQCDGTIVVVARHRGIRLTTANDRELDICVRFAEDRGLGERVTDLWWGLTDRGPVRILKAGLRGRSPVDLCWAARLLFRVEHGSTLVPSHDPWAGYLRDRFAEGVLVSGDVASPQHVALTSRRDP